MSASGPVAELVKAIRSGRTSARAVMTEAIARVAAYDAAQPAVWISRFADADLLARAESLDARLAAGEDLPLAGVPFAVKDNIDVAGLPTTAGCPAFAYAPERSAETVARLEAAGAICIGKTNLDQFATGLVGTRSPYGAPACVFNRAYISGGSSSGSAVAVAAGLVPFALGTDTAGSGRVPAAINGLVGFKPTKGRWSTRGLVPACRTLDCITVFTHSASDAALLDRVIAGFDAADDYSRVIGDVALGQGAALKLGAPLQSQRAWFGDTQSADLYARALQDLAELGHQIIEVDIAPLLAAARLLYQGPWLAERTAALQPLLRDQPEAIDPVVRDIVSAGQAMSAVDAFNGNYELARLARQAQGLWGQIDALALPTAPTVYRQREIAQSPIALNASLGTYTNFVNLLDMAAIAVPAGFRRNRTGFGVSFIGPAGADTALIDLAEQWGRAQPVSAPPLDLEGVMEDVHLAVVGAHLEGMPLHWQLTSRSARLVARTHTAPTYRLYAMADSTPPKPALVFDATGGAIQIEVYALSVADFGGFTAEVPPPLAIGTIALADGTSVKGFVCEPRALVNATDITHFGGWRAYLARSTAASG
jgi:allophanate hydrolase